LSQEWFCGSWSRQQVNSREYGLCWRSVVPTTSVLIAWQILWLSALKHSVLKYPFGESLIMVFSMLYLGEIKRTIICKALKTVLAYCKLPIKKKDIPILFYILLKIRPL
jgi:hypothetical protein